MDSSESVWGVLFIIGVAIIAVIRLWPKPTQEEKEAKLLEKNPQAWAILKQEQVRQAERQKAEEERKKQQTSGLIGTALAVFTWFLLDD